jgi:cytochrome b561
MTQTRYNTLSIILHWLMAVCIILMIPFGWGLSDMDPKEAEGLGRLFIDLGVDRGFGFMIHKSVGLTLLVLTVVRIAIRVMTPTPAYPFTMRPLEKRLAKLTHIGFYLAMIGAPLSGWAIASTGKYPTSFFGLFTWPPLSFLANMEPGLKNSVHEVAEFAHSKWAWVLIALLCLHILAALKHQFMDRDNIVSRMSLRG